jgi:hypothetical protein
MAAAGGAFCGLFTYQRFELGVVSPRPAPWPMQTLVAVFHECRMLRAVPTNARAVAAGAPVGRAELRDSLWLWLDGAPTPLALEVDGHQYTELFGAFGLGFTWHPLVADAAAWRGRIYTDPRFMHLCDVPPHATIVVSFPDFAVCVDGETIASSLVPRAAP